MTCRCETDRYIHTQTEISKTGGAIFKASVNSSFIHLTVFILFSTYPFVVFIQLDLKPTGKLQISVRFYMENSAGEDDIVGFFMI